MERSPPPFFKQGPSANARLLFFSLFAITLLIVDSRLNALGRLREGIATVLYPVQRALLVPRDLADLGTEYLADVNRLRAENAELRRLEAANANALLQTEQLATENQQLRQLLAMRERTAIRSTVAEVLYDTRDAFSRKLVLDKGQQHGVIAGQPVIDASGVAGQITRVYPLSSEVTLVTDRGSTIPVEIRRTGERSVAFGGSQTGTIELRYLRTNADVREGDVLVTSGLDGLFPPGLPVGTVSAVETASSAFVQVRVETAARVERTRLLLILLAEPQALPAPPPEPAAESRRRRRRD
ncbi:MAG: rod shape-determining protein MreC [Burkholderiales bacterium]|nr:MAG: rod shape-determining protein MreC [Burkholderiales bacterium]RPH68192.1 MAG: rod shape-determining protein MreC [Burkholderiales bacterium]